MTEKPMKFDREMFALRVFQREVARQCQNVLRASTQLIDARSENTDGSTWYALQNFCIAAANVSKLLWGVKAQERPLQKYRENQRRRLRTSLGVANNSVLRMSPEFRNHLEHMDERIEEWSRDTSRPGMANDIIGTPDHAAARQTDPGDVFRVYDPETWTFWFQGDRFELRPVLSAAQRLLDVAAQECEKSYFVPSDDSDDSASSEGAG